MVSNYLVGQHMSVRTQEATATTAVSWMMFSSMQRVRTLSWPSTLSAIAVVIRGVFVGPVVVVVVIAVAVVVVGVIVVIFHVGSPVKSRQKKKAEDTFLSSLAVPYPLLANS